jgi:hypothetical protein
MSEFAAAAAPGGVHALLERIDALLGGEDSEREGPGAGAALSAVRALQAPLLDLAARLAQGAEAPPVDADADAALIRTALYLTSPEVSPRVLAGMRCIALQCSAWHTSTLQLMYKSNILITHTDNFTYII